MFVKPIEGVLVRDPQTLMLLPPEGAEVPDTKYWARRLADGSVVETPPPKSNSKVKAPEVAE